MCIGCDLRFLLPVVLWVSSYFIDYSIILATHTENDGVLGVLGRN